MLVDLAVFSRIEGRVGGYYGIGSYASAQGPKRDLLISRAVPFGEDGAPITPCGGTAESGARSGALVCSSNGTTSRPSNSPQPTADSRRQRSEEPNGSRTRRAV